MKAALAEEWPEDPPAPSEGDFRKEGKEVKEDKEDEDGVVVVGVGEGAPFEWQDCILTEPGSGYWKRFRLARKMKGAMRLLGSAFPEERMYGIFNRWVSASDPYLDEKGKDWGDFLAIMDTVTNPEGMILLQAFERSERKPTIDKLKPDRFHINLKRLGSLCRELHAYSGGKPIMLSQLAISKLMCCQPRMVSYWIKSLKTLGVLKLVTKGVKEKSASTYSYHE